jgi:hypothetical protein
MGYRNDKDALVAQVSALQGELQGYQEQNPCRHCGASNPQNARFCAQCAGKLLPLGHPPIPRRELWQVALLSIVTLSLYNIYLVWRWTIELNRLHGQPQRKPVWVLVLGILTMGIATMIYECLYAREVEDLLQHFGYPRQLAQRLQTRVVVFNVCGLALSCIPFGAIVGIPLGTAATVTLQRELNSFSSGSAG